MEQAASKLASSGGAGLEQQAGVALRRQLLESGWTRYQIEANVDARRWQACGSMVLVLHNGPLTYEQQLWAAVLNAGTHAALCGRTAAATAGLAGWAPPVVEIVVPRGEKVPSMPQVPLRVHESRRFDPGNDTHPSRLPAQTRPARSVVDAAAWTRRARSACGLLAAAVQQGLVLPAHLIEELEHAGGVRHHRLLNAVVYDIAGGAQALSEIDFGRLCVRYGLPRPERQVLRHDRDGRRRYLDAVLRGRDGREVVVEIDGALHLLAERYWDDMHRDNELVLAGKRRLRIPTVALHVDPGRAMRQVAAALGLP